MVIQDICGQISRGNKAISAVMIESFLHEGNQSLTTKNQLKYGQSITDECIGWQETETVLRILSKAILRRRKSTS